MSWFSNLSPIPAFPDYSGPYKVGTVDIEIPVTDLESPSPAPDSTISTVAFRVFYPCETGSSHRPVRWVPSPQRSYLSAYSRFLGAGSAFAEFFSYVPQLLYYITIPAYRNARLLSPPTKSNKWPVMVFSHGLGGSRNAYSHITGSLASHGIVVVAPDHRDGSAPISFIRATNESEARTVEYRKVPHAPSPEVYQSRDEQLKIRLWELGLIHDALLKVDEGTQLENLDENSSSHWKNDRNDVLPMFKGQLDVQEPGSIAWAGHSFGAATSVQFVKSIFWRGDSPLFTPAPRSRIVRQINPHTPVVLLDLWCLPLRSSSTRVLWEKPMPCYASSGPGGTVLVSIISEAFFKWRGNLQDTKRVLSEKPSSNRPPHTKPGPRFFYSVSSAHLSQSDFGILFPWITKKVFKAEEPERTLKLNVRAILQMLRDNGVEVADTSRTDMEENATDNSRIPVGDSNNGQDRKIFTPNRGVRGWVAVSTDLHDSTAATSVETDRKKGPSDAVVEGELLGEMKQQRV